MGFKAARCRLHRKLARRATDIGLPIICYTCTYRSWRCLVTRSPLPQKKIRPARRPPERDGFYR